MLLILAVGIGANASVFAVVDGVLLRPLPYRDPDRLFVIQELRPPTQCPQAVNLLHFEEWRRACSCFEQIALSFNGYVNLTGAGGDPERVSNAGVTPSFFSMLGVRARTCRPWSRSIPPRSPSGVFS